jgi:hypothetical protein
MGRLCWATGRLKSGGGWVNAPWRWRLIGSCFRFFIPFFPLYFLVLDFILFKFLGVQRDQAKAILSKQAVKIATKAEEHERFIFKVISLLPSIPLPNLPFFSLVLL